MCSYAIHDFFVSSYTSYYQLKWCHTNTEWPPDRKLTYKQVWVCSNMYVHVSMCVIFRGVACSHFLHYSNCFGNLPILMQRLITRVT